MQVGMRQGAEACQCLSREQCSDTCQWSLAGHWSLSRLKEVTAELTAQTTIITLFATAVTNFRFLDQFIIILAPEHLGKVIHLSLWSFLLKVAKVFNPASGLL